MLGATAPIQPETSPVLAGARRYARVWRACVRNCLVRELEFRSSFLLKTGTDMLWSVLSMYLAGLVFTNVRQIAGWDLDRMFILTGTFLIVEGLGAAFVQRSMEQLASQVNKGELDFVLIRPISSQFLVSVRYVAFSEIPTALIGLVYVTIGLGRLGITPEPAQVAAYVVMVVAALVSLYAVWFMSVTLTLWTGRINNVTSALHAFISLGRMPSDVYAGVARILFVFGLPIAAMATLPTKALLGVLEPAMLPYQVGLAAFLLWGSHRFWHVSLRQYTSASS